MNGFEAPSRTPATDAATRLAPLMGPASKAPVSTIRDTSAISAP